MSRRMGSSESSQGPGDKVNGRHHDLETTSTTPSRHTTSVLVFWPESILSLDSIKEAVIAGQSQVILGWVIRGAPNEVSVVVIGLTPAEHLSRLQRHGLVAVGDCCLFDGKAKSATARSSDDMDATSVWISVDLPLSSAWQALSRWKGRQQPAQALRIASIHIEPPGESKEAIAGSSLAVSVISYRSPNTSMLQYYTLESLRLGPVSGLRLAELGSLLMRDETLSQFLAQRDSHYPVSTLRKKLISLFMLDPLRWEELVGRRRATGALDEGTALRQSITLINKTKATVKALARAKSQTQAAASWSLLQLFLPVVAALAALARALRALLAIEIQLGKSEGLRVSLLAVSASARQLDTRLTQLLVAPPLAPRLRALRKKGKLPIEDISAPYIGLWNSVWLIANDVILGQTASIVIVQNHKLIAQWLRRGFQYLFLDAVLRLLEWLGDWPAGLKLNTELSLFFGDAYSTSTALWRSEVISLVVPHLETIVLLFALIGRVAGVTMVLCMLGDLVRLATLHITVFHACSRRTLRFFIHVLSALFDLFRGKKRNALRGGRLDDATYELDQLLLGTIMFTLTAFLFPTVYIYYLAFASVRLAVVGFEAAIIETLLGLLNHIPLFALMLRVKDQARLPAGIWLELVEAFSDGDCQRFPRYVPATRYVLRSHALSIKDIFEGYADHLQGILDLPQMALRALCGDAIR